MIGGLPRGFRRTADPPTHGHGRRTVPGVGQNQPRVGPKGTSAGRPRHGCRRQWWRPPRQPARTQATVRLPCPSGALSHKSRSVSCAGPNRRWRPRGGQLRCGLRRALSCARQHLRCANCPVPTSTRDTDQDTAPHGTQMVTSGTGHWVRQAASRSRLPRPAAPASCAPNRDSRHAARPDVPDARGAGRSADCAGSATGAPGSLWPCKDAEGTLA